MLVAVILPLPLPAAALVPGLAATVSILVLLRAAACHPRAAAGTAATGTTAAARTTTHALRRGLPLQVVRERGGVHVVGQRHKAGRALRQVVHRRGGQVGRGSGGGGGGAGDGQHGREMGGARRAAGRRVQRVNDQRRQVLHHAQQQAVVPRVLLVDVRVGVDLDEPGAEVAVNEEVVAKELEGAAALAALHQAVAVGEHGVQDELLHARQEVGPEVNEAGAVGGVQERLQLLERQRVALLERAQVLAVLLHAVVGEVHHLRGVVAVAGARAGLAAEVQREQLGGGAAVAVLVHVDVELVVHHHPDADVKLAAVDEQRQLAVLLHHPLRARRHRRAVHRQAVAVHRHEVLLDGRQLRVHLDALALVQVRRLHQPHVAAAVLGGHALAAALHVAAAQLPEVRAEAGVLGQAAAANVAQDEGGGHVVKHLQPQPRVVVAQVARQARLGGDALDGREVVHELPPGPAVARGRRLHRVDGGQVAGVQLHAQRRPPAHVKGVGQQALLRQLLVPPPVHARRAAKHGGRQHRAHRAARILILNRRPPPRPPLQRAAHQLRVVAQEHQVPVHATATATSSPTTTSSSTTTTT